MQSVKTRMICLLLTVLYICLWSNLSLFATSEILNTLRNLYTCVQYGILCPKNNLNIRIKTEPVTVGADPTVQCKCMSGFCTVLVSVLVRITLPLLFRLSLVRFFFAKIQIYLGQCAEEDSSWGYWHEHHVQRAGVSHVTNREEIYILRDASGQVTTFPSASLLRAYYSQSSQASFVAYEATPSFCTFKKQKLHTLSGTSS